MGRGSGYSQRFPGKTPAPAGATAGGATPKRVTVRCWNIEHDDDLADYVMVVVAAGGVVLDWERIDPDKAHEQAQIEVLIPDGDVEAFEARLQAACQGEFDLAAFRDYTALWGEPEPSEATVSELKTMLKVWGKVGQVSNSSSPFSLDRTLAHYQRHRDFYLDFWRRSFEDKRRDMHDQA